MSQSNRLYIFNSLISFAMSGGKINERGNATAKARGHLSKKVENKRGLKPVFAAVITKLMQALIKIAVVNF